MFRKSLMLFIALIVSLVALGTSDAYLDTQTGRFITQDPYLGEATRPPSLHRYNYARSNPTAFVDKNGYDYVEVQDNKAYWVIEKDVPGPFNPDTRRVYIGDTKEKDPKNVYLTSEFGDGTVDIKVLKQGASSYWGRYDVEEGKSIFSPADISSLDPSLQDQLIRHYIQNRMDPHNQGGIYAERPIFRSKTDRNLDRIQTAGDYAGIALDVIDLPNTVLYGLRGKWEDFGFGFAAMFPVVGPGAISAKYGKKGAKFIDEGMEVASKNTQGHHSIPQYMGGRKNQPLVDLADDVHGSYHEFLDNWDLPSGMAPRSPAPNSFGGEVRPWGRENAYLREFAADSKTNREFIVDNLRKSYKEHGTYDAVKNIFEKEAKVFINGGN